MVSPDVSEFLKYLGTGGGTLCIGYLGHRMAKRNARVTEQSSRFDQVLKPLVEANTAWAAINAPLMERITRLEVAQERNKERRDQMEERMEILEDQSSRAMDVVTLWATWIQQGAPPPPPEVPGWVAEHLQQMARDIITGPIPEVKKTEGDKGVTG